MSTSAKRFAQLVDALNQHTGLTLRADNGTTAFVDGQRAYWQLSSGLGSDVLHVHTTLAPLADFGVGVLRHLLAFNTEPALLRGAALGVRDSAEEIELLHTVAMDGLDGASLTALLEDLMTVRDAVTARLQTLEGVLHDAPVQDVAPLPSAKSPLVFF